MWLFANGIRMEFTSDLVADGKLIHETSYNQRPGKYFEIDIEGSKIDFYDSKRKVIHETKRSDAREEAHEWQVKYYIYLLKKNGIDGVKGIIEYPRLRETTEVMLSEKDEDYLRQLIPAIEQLIVSDACPARITRKRCKHCSYFDFCWTEELDILRD